MQTKEQFVSPTVEFVIFPKQDIVTTSGDIIVQPVDQGDGIVLPDNDV